MPAVDPVGSQRGRPESAPPAVEPVEGVLPAPISLPGREVEDGRLPENSGVAPHRISLRHSDRLLRLPLKGGVILGFLTEEFCKRLT